ncbi:LysR family transcriptional regulator [Thaumasiovibrio subtropicus]|uniref:LysR family transcriptional regulator n=1 Tax=Thaumasiovibrio subtropicus TaxID=1891207 RepID=UPI000B34D1C2|nr:LysR family transcriptional regulator [Thaumasiovibrio subtropicus]
MISPNIEHLHYFTTVVEMGSFTAAGRKLNRDRSSIGQAIANLEIDLGVTLFDRHGRTITLTPEGEALYGKARTLLQGYQSFCQFSQNLSSDIESSLTIGIDHFTTLNEMSRIDKAIHTAFPGLHVHWQRQHTDALDPLLEAGTIDIALRLFQNRDLPEVFHPQHVDNVTLVSVMHRDTAESHPTQRLHSELRKVPLIAYPDLDKVVRTDRFENVQQVFSPEAALEIVSQKAAWSIFPLQLISPESERYIQVSLDTNAPMYGRRILIWHHSHRFGKAQRWLANQLTSLLS